MSVMGKKKQHCQIRCSGVPGCSGVPAFRCVPVFRCSGVPGFSTCPSNRRNEIIQLNFTANLKFDSKVDSPLTPQCQISWENSRFNYLDNNIQRISP